MSTITVPRAVLEQALEALEATYYDVGPAERQRLQAVDAIAALRAALAQQGPDLRNANPIGLTPPQKALQQAQFRADALAQQEQEPVEEQR